MPPARTGAYSWPALSTRRASRGEGVRVRVLGTSGRSGGFVETGAQGDEVIAVRFSCLASATEYARWQSISQKYFSCPRARSVSRLTAENPNQQGEIDDRA